MPRALRSWKLAGLMALSATAATLWLLLPQPIQSQSGASADYRLIATDAAAAGYAASANYHLYSTNGQSGGEGVASSASYKLQTGFLQRAFLSASTPTSTPTATFTATVTPTATNTPPPVAVGGIAEQPDVTALRSGASSSGRGYAIYIVGVGMASVFAAAAAVGWRRRLARKG